jgi:ElaB/YqjD/DUF883 family membrane-anchored ribosome-binding protein
MATPDAGKKAEELIEEGAARAKEVVNTVSQKAASTRAAAEEALHDGQDVVENALACAKDMVRANPIASLAVVAAVAYLCGKLRS